MPTVACGICGNSFYVKPSHQKIGWGKYCSVVCRSKAQFNGKNVNCHICGKQIYRSLARQKKSISGMYFCSKSCQTRWRNGYFIGEKHSNWTNGISAYRRVLERSGGIPACSLCKLTDKRVLSVHHIDHNRLNNDKSNLVWVCFNCHFLVHHDKDVEKNLEKVILKE
jgi:hypothetical protein